VSTDTDALVPTAWYRPCTAPQWAHAVLVPGHEPPAPLTESQALNVGWVKFYSADTIERLTRERDEAVALLEDWVGSFADTIEGGEADPLVIATRAAIATTKATT
jgi:hypothetical protein